MSKTQTQMASYAEVRAKNLDEQAHFFLQRYMNEFTGRWEEVLDNGQEFRKFNKSKARDGELTEEDFRYYLEKNSQTMTSIQLRESFKSLDLDSNKGVAFLDYLIWKFKKTKADVMAVVETPLPADLAAKINADIAVYQGVQEAERARFEKIAALTALVEAGGAKGLAAKAELEQLRTEDTLARNKAKVEADKRRRNSQSALQQWEAHSEAEKAAQIAAEKKAVDDSKAAAAAAEEAKRQEGRKKVEAKAALWSN